MEDELQADDDVEESASDDDMFEADEVSKPLEPFP